MIRNQAGQTVGAQMISATTGAAFAGPVSVYVTGDAGTQALGSVSGGAAVLEGNGFYTYHPSIDETNYANVAYTFVGSGAIPATISIDTLTAGQFLALTAGSDLLIYSAGDLIRNALYELMVYGPGDSISGDDNDFGLSKLTRLIDNWNAKRRAVWGMQFQSFTVTANHQPHSIGASAADWATTQRPQSIDAAAFIIGNSRYPVETDHSSAWWQSRPAQTFGASIPTDLYYASDWPNGAVYLWPVPTVAGTLEIMSSMVIAQLGLTDLVSFPPGYLDAIILTLAEDMSTAHEVRVGPKLESKAREARATIFANNDEAYPIETRDSGLPGGGAGTRGNYLTGWWRTR